MIYSAVSYIDDRTGCSAARLMTFVQKGHYVIGKRDTEFKGAQEIDLTFDRSFKTVHVSDLVDGFNASKLDGIDEWAIDKEIDISQAVRTQGGDSWKTVFAIYENSLFFGSDHITMEPKIRTVEINYKKKFLKK